jgi:HAD superfamily hydrolase (TIGR01509 family)
MIPLRPGAVIFDCDGVLVDSEPVTNRLIRDDLAEHGLPMTIEQVMAAFVGGTMEGVAEKARGMGAALPQDWVSDFYPRMFAALEREVTEIEGAAALVAQLVGNGLAVAVASNGPSRKMQITLERTGLARHFGRHVYSAHDLPRPKPAPDVYLHAAAQLGIDPASCVVIEDSTSGAQAAQAAGMRCFGLAADGGGASLAPYCVHVVPRLSALPPLLGL